MRLGLDEGDKEIYSVRWDVDATNKRERIEWINAYPPPPELQTKNVWYQYGAADAGEYAIDVIEPQTSRRCAVTAPQTNNGSVPASLLASHMTSTFLSIFPSASSFTYGLSSEIALLPGTFSPTSTVAIGTAPTVVSVSSSVTPSSGAVFQPEYRYLVHGSVAEQWIQFGLFAVVNRTMTDGIKSWFESTNYRWDRFGYYGLKGWYREPGVSDRPLLQLIDEGTLTNSSGTFTFRVMYDFRQFRTDRPHPKLFELPDVCQAKKTGIPGNGGRWIVNPSIISSTGSAGPSGGVGGENGGSSSPLGNASPSSRSSLSTGAIIGTTIGIFVFLLLLLSCYWLRVRKNRPIRGRRRMEDEEEEGLRGGMEDASYYNQPRRTTESLGGNVDEASISRSTTKRSGTEGRPHIRRGDAAHPDEMEAIHIRDSDAPMLSSRSAEPSYSRGGIIGMTSLRPSGVRIDEVSLSKRGLEDQE